MRPLTKQIADFIHQVGYEDLPNKAVETAKYAFLDYFAVAIGGANEPISLNLLAWAKERNKHKQAHTIFSGEHLDIENTALVNGAAGHALDFDDNSWVTIAHPSTVLVPTILSVAEAHRLSGKDAIFSYVVGLEIIHQIAKVVMPEVADNAWHTTPVFYTLGATICALVLLKPSRDCMVNALGIACSRSSGLRCNFGTQTKPYHAGMASRAGLEAVSLAQQGLNANEGVFEGEVGFVRAFAGEKKLKPFQKKDDFLQIPTKSEDWDIVKNGLVFKLYPNCSGNHPACDLMFNFLKKEKFTWAEVESIKVGTGLLSPKELIYNDPQTPTEAKFSIQFALAAILVFRELGLNEFSEEKLKDKRVGQVMKSINKFVDDELAVLGFVGYAPIKIWIKLKNGKEFYGRNDLAKGNPEKPFLKEDFEKKFYKCVSSKLPEGRIKSLLQMLFNFETVTDVTQVIKKTLG